MTRRQRAQGEYALLLLLIAGCSSAHKSDELNKEEEAIAHVGAAYRDASHFLKRGPASVKELKPYLKKYGDPDTVLTSPNDGQPYQINWGLIPSRPSRSAQTQRILAYEQAGKDGKRYVLDFMLKVHHLNDAEFERMRDSK